VKVSTKTRGERRVPGRLAVAGLMLAVTFLAVVIIAAAPARAAVGCSLNDPDRDVIRLFPTATSYRTEFVSIEERGGDTLAARVEVALGDELDDVFESLDVPYAYYTVLTGTDPIGRIHGVNQKGMYGGMQLILATDMTGVIKAFYYQRLSSPESGRFRNEDFTSGFVGLTLDDLLVLNAAVPGGDAELPDRLAIIKDPSEESREDFEATVRGLTKNLILLHEFFSIETDETPDSEGGTR